MRTNKRVVYPYICSDCAKMRGAKWPENYCATIHSEICHYCNLHAGLSHISDWNWPKGCHIGDQAGGREL